MCVCICVCMRVQQLLASVYEAVSVFLCHALAFATVLRSAYSKKASTTCICMYLQTNREGK